MGLLCLGPGLRAACSSRNPNSAGRAPHSHPTEAPFWRRRAPTQFPAPWTRHFQGRWGRRWARVPSRIPAPRPQSAHNRRQARHPGMQGSWACPGAPSQVRGATDGHPQNSLPGITREPNVALRARRRSPQPRPASRPRYTGGPGAPRLPRCPVLPPQRGRTLTRRRRPTRPVPGAQHRGSEEKAKKDAEKESQISLELATFPKPSQSPVQPPPPPPGRQGAQRAAGTRWPGYGAGWEAPRRRALARTLEKSAEHWPLESHQLSAPSSRRRACPAPLSPSAWAA